MWAKGGNTTTVEDMHKRQPYELLGGLVIQEHHRKGILITEQQLFEHNPLYDFIQETDTDTTTGSDSSVHNQTAQGIYNQHKGNIT